MFMGIVVIRETLKLVMVEFLLTLLHLRLLFVIEFMVAQNELGNRFALAWLMKTITSKLLFVIA